MTKIKFFNYNNYYFSREAIHLIGFSTVCYGVIITQDPKLIHM